MASRYNKFRVNGSMLRLPLIKLSNKDSDYFEYYKRNVTTLDGLSYKYYDDPNYAWVIMMANQEYGSLEYNIPDGALLRIPYPLDDTLSDYEYRMTNLLKRYKLDNLV